MIFIDTRIAPPDAERIARLTREGHSVVHVPALECVPTGVPVVLEGCEAVFVASPRAAALAAGVLRQFPGEVWAVGPSTAESLRGAGVTVARAGDGRGAAAFFSSLAAACGDRFPARSVGWISAEETAENREDLSRLHHFSLRHFPVYRTMPRVPDEDFLRTLSSPRTWLFYSGKAVSALRKYIVPEDAVELHGHSAARAGAGLSHVSVIE